MTLTQETLGARLREARTNAQLSQDEAAAAVGLDRTALLKIEKGTRAVSGTELCASRNCITATSLTCSPSSLSTTIHLLCSDGSPVMPRPSGMSK
jgi:DNA-binding XRE family transcriptional regulator